MIFDSQNGGGGLIVYLESALYSDRVKEHTMIRVGFQ